jgi:hypothetical protein
MRMRLGFGMLLYLWAGGALGAQTPADLVKHEATVLETLKTLMTELESGDKARQLKAVNAIRPTPEELKLLTKGVPAEREQAEKSLAEGTKWYEANIETFAKKLISDQKRRGPIQSVTLVDMRTKDGMDGQHAMAMPAEIIVVDVNYKTETNQGSLQGAFFLVNGRWLWSRVWGPGR